MRTILPPHTWSSRLRQATLSATLALLLSACGGGNSGTDLGQTAGSSNASAALSPSRSIALQTQGAALNTSELDNALTEAKALPADTALAPGQVAPLTAYKSGQVAQKAAAMQVPVYRFYNTRTGTHFYSSSSTERDEVRATLDYMSYEGQAFLAASQASAGLKPVYRFYNTDSGVHFYTISSNERDLIQANLPQFSLEGIAYYASSVAGTGLKPLYRFFLSNAGTHFYTASADERQNVQDTLSATHTYEGVGYYVLTGDCSLVNGTAQLATPNACYLANSAAEVTITLPQSADLEVGDSLRVSGLGAGGWRISQNANQRIQTTLADTQPFVWSPHESNRKWRSVASSADGNKLVAVGEASQIYTSLDAGLTWTPREFIREWTAVASSADGNKLVATAHNGSIYTSSDAGLNWTPRASGQSWLSVASSADGNKLVAVVLGGQIHTSSDAGLNWTARESNRNWVSVTSSADGNKLAAVVLDGQIYTSGNGGINWTPHEATRRWISVASSADGNKLLAANFGSGSGGQLYRSSDAGLTWTAQETNRTWYAVASSADGNKLVALVNSGRIYTSSDAGLNWVPRDVVRGWISVASSADGSKLAAVDYGTGSGGQIYTAESSTAPGVTGAIQGTAGSAIELKYLGNHVFEMVSSSGMVSLVPRPL